MTCRAGRVTHTHTQPSNQNVADFHNEVQEVKRTSSSLAAPLRVVLLNPLHLHDLVFPPAPRKLIRPLQPSHNPSLPPELKSHLNVAPSRIYMK